MATGASLSDSHRWHTKTAAQVTRKDVNQVDRVSGVRSVFSSRKMGVWRSVDGVFAQGSERAGLSRAELAHKMVYPRVRFWNLETGRHVPCAQTLQAIATVLNLLGPANPPIDRLWLLRHSSGLRRIGGPGVWQPDDMLHLYERLRRALCREGGYLPLPWLLSDPACATVFSDFQSSRPLVQRGL